MCVFSLLACLFLGLHFTHFFSLTVSCAFSSLDSMLVFRLTVACASSLLVYLFLGLQVSCVCVFCLFTCFFVHYLLSFAFF